MATDDEVEEELRKRVAELEERLDELTTAGEVATDAQGREWTAADLMNLGLTRRQALGAIAALGVGGVSLLEAIRQSVGTARAVGTGEVGQIGESGSPIDIYAEDLYDINDNAVLEFQGDGSIASVTTDTLNNADIQNATDGTVPASDGAGNLTMESIGGTDLLLVEDANSPWTPNAITGSNSETFNLSQSATRIYVEFDIESSSDGTLFLDSSGTAASTWSYYDVSGSSKLTETIPIARIGLDSRIFRGFFRLGSGGGGFSEGATYWGSALESSASSDLPTDNATNSSGDTQISSFTFSTTNGDFDVSADVYRIEKA